MNTFIQKIWNFIKTHKKTSVFVLLVVIGIGFALRGGSNKGVTTITAVKGTVVQEVSVTGKTKPNKSVDLAFETSGKVSSAPLAIGGRVTAGQVLAVLDQSELSANLAKAKADLHQEQIKLDQISKQSGDTYQNARSSMISSIRDAYARTDDSIRNNVDQFFFKNTAQSNTFIDFSFTDGTYQYTPTLDSALRASVNSSRSALNVSLDHWQTSLLSLSTATDLTPYVAEAEKNLNDTRSFLNNVAQLVNGLPQPDFDHVSTIAGYRSTVSEARTNISTALSNLVTAKDKLNNAPREAQNGTGVTAFDDVLSQQARVAQFEAQVQSSSALLAKATLVSPITGVITKYDTKAGEIVTTGTPLISVISDNDLQIDANVSEVNIGKLTIGNQVAITFDAFPGKTFTGSVIYIDPGETIVDGVVNYKVTITFDQADQQVKSGLTANLIVQTAKKDDVIKVPQYAIIKKDNQLFVDKVEGKVITQVPVTIGFNGNDGSVEVLSGINVGDVIQVPVQ
jgi:RND family efflux transporter MFP subunit